MLLDQRKATGKTQRPRILIPSPAPLFRANKGEGRVSGNETGWAGTWMLIRRAGQRETAIPFHEMNPFEMVST